MNVTYCYLEQMNIQSLIQNDPICTLLIPQYNIAPEKQDTFAESIFNQCALVQSFLCSLVSKTRTIERTVKRCNCCRRAIYVGVSKEKG